MLISLMRYGDDLSTKGLDSSRTWSDHPMMQGVGNAGLWVYGILHLVTWILVITVLIGLVRWLWKKGDKTRRPNTTFVQCILKSNQTNLAVVPSVVWIWLRQKPMKT